MRKKFSLLFWLIPLLIIVTMFLIVPVISMLIGSFQDSGGAVTIDNYKVIISDPYYINAIYNSVIIAIVSSIISLILGIFCAYELFKSNSKLLVLINLTSNFSGVPLAFAFIILLGNSGLFIILMQKLGHPLNFTIYSWAGICIAYVYFQLPLAIMLLIPVFNAIKKNVKESAKLLGANSFSFWKKIGIPIMLPALLGTVVILFANAMGAFVTAYTLGGSNFNLLSIRIGALTTGDIFAKPELASALGVILCLILFGVIGINAIITKYMRKDIYR